MDQSVLRLEQTMREIGIKGSSERIVVALSGGPDSVALLHLLHQLTEKLPCALVAAHVNHGFRPQASEQEEKLAAELAAGLNIPFEQIKLDMPAVLRDSGDNAQAAARELRYQFLAQIAEKHQAGYIALAHHADDQAETIVMRFIRGTGPAGLAGMPAVRTDQAVRYIRPLLGWRKQELEAYCTRMALNYCLDESNLQRKYTRNRIRLDVIPYLTEHNPQLTANLLRMADLCGAENDYMEQESRRLFDQIVTIDQSGCHFSRKAVLPLHLALQRRVIKLILYYLFPVADAWGFHTVETVNHIIMRESKPSIYMDFHERVTLIREYDHIRLLYRKPSKLERNDFEYIIDHLSEPLTYLLPNGRIEVSQGSRAEYGEESVKRQQAEEVWFDRQALRLPLYIRNRREGDRMYVWGLNGSKKVKDMFIDAKIPAAERANIPLLVDSDDRILWIPGVRRSIYASITDGTAGFIRVIYSKDEAETRFGMEN